MFEWYENPLFVISIIFSLAFGFISFCFWNTSKNDALLYNQKFGTTYTASQFFWSGDTIKSFINEGHNSTLNLKIK